MPRAPKSVSTKSAAKTRTISESTSQPATREAIAQRAYELFLQSGGEHGRDIEHWLTAERELGVSTSASVLNFKQTA